MGVIGNPMNLINIVIAENEENSPFKPFSVRKGFEKGENVVSLFEGWGILSAANWKVNRWAGQMDYPQIAKDIIAQQGMFTATLVLSPPIANFIKQRFDTIEAFEKWAAPPPSGMFGPPPESDSEGDAPPPRRPAFSFPTSNVIVTGASNNNYWSAGGLSYSRSIKIDDWR